MPGFVSVAAGIRFDTVHLRLSDDRLLSDLCDELARAGFAAVAGAGRGEVEVLLPEGEQSPLAGVFVEELRRWQEQHAGARVELEP